MKNSYDVQYAKAVMKTSLTDLCRVIRENCRFRVRKGFETWKNKRICGHVLRNKMNLVEFYANRLCNITSKGLRRRLFCSFYQVKQMTDYPFVDDCLGKNIEDKFMSEIHCKQEEITENNKRLEEINELYKYQLDNERLYKDKILEIKKNKESKFLYRGGYGDMNREIEILQDENFELLQKVKACEHTVGEFLKEFQQNCK
jgi:hypothetical protein